MVGAGVVGCHTAYQLARRGRRVLLLDRVGAAAGASGATAAHLTVQTRAPGVMLDLALASIHVLGELETELDLDFEMVRSGGLVVAEDEAEYGILRQFVKSQSTRVPVLFLEAPELRRSEPFLSDRLVGAAYCLLDGYLNPMLLCRALCRGATGTREADVGQFSMRPPLEPIELGGLAASASTRRTSDA